MQIIGDLVCEHCGNLKGFPVYSISDGLTWYECLPCSLAKDAPRYYVYFNTGNGWFLASIHSSPNSAKHQVLVSVQGSAFGGLYLLAKVLDKAGSMVYDYTVNGTIPEVVE